MFHLLHIKKGVTQGDPLDMIAYGMGILPLIWDLQTAHHGVTHLWYDDGAGAVVTFSSIRQHLDNLMV